jgi:hypothetical protein
MCSASEPGTPRRGRAAPRGLIAMPGEPAHSTHTGEGDVPHPEARPTVVPHEGRMSDSTGTRDPADGVPGGGADE